MQPIQSFQESWAEHAEEIQNSLHESAGYLASETTGILDQLKATLALLDKISQFYNPSREMSSRMESAYIELKDIASEVEQEAGKAVLEPGELEKLRQRMDLLIGLMQKHRVQELGHLIVLRDKFGEKIEDLTFSDEKIVQLKKETL